MSGKKILQDNDRDEVSSGFCNKRGLLQETVLPQTCRAVTRNQNHTHLSSVLLCREGNHVLNRLSILVPAKRRKRRKVSPNSLHFPYTELCVRADHWRCQPSCRSTSISVALQEQHWKCNNLLNMLVTRPKWARPKCAFAAQEVPSGLDEPEDKAMLWKSPKRVKSPLTCSGREGSSCCPVAFVKSSVEISWLHLAGSSHPSSPPHKITPSLRKNSAEAGAGEIASSVNVNCLSPGPMSKPNLTNSSFKLSSAEIAKQCLISRAHI